MSSALAAPPVSSQSMPDSTAADQLSNDQLPEIAQGKLEQVFGFSQVRPGQAEVISALLDGRSALAIFPTGGGKSLCYQLPALVLDGLTLVVSPLIALMKDQIDFLRSKGVAAERLDSSLTREENLRVYDDLRSGKTRLLYVSPERLGNERFLTTLRSLNIALLAVDEAHCISAWGHNFRPDYLRIASLAKKLQLPRVLALTATATPEVAADIEEAFDIAPEDAVKTGFYRPNLDLHAAPCEDEARKRTLVQRLKSRQSEPAIVYVTLQKTAELVAKYLEAAGINACAYHAGMNTDERTKIQEAFMSAEDMVVVATIAFGMGIDKANIRAVYHYNLPKGLESYMQEIGRAGRDGQRSHCELLACADDIITLENFSYGDTPTRDAVNSLAEEIFRQGETIELSLYHLAREHDVRDLVIKTMLTYLELEGLLQPTGAIYTEYKFKPQRSSREILNQFNEERSKFITDVFRQTRKSGSWVNIDVAVAAQNLKQPRERIIAALEYLDSRGDILLQTAGVRHVCRRLRVPDDHAELVDLLYARFLEREEQDIARIRSVVDFVESPGCLTQTVLSYFGEEREPCGHCDRCNGAQPKPLPSSIVSLTDSDRRIVQRVAAERLEPLRTPRQLTRFLCGVTSPAASKAKLRSHKDFASLERVPFGEVLAYAEELLN